VPDFPLTGSGKVQKFAIREKFLSGSYGEVLQGVDPCIWVALTE
jgi:fatty-acyl-CoA synthase